MGEQMTFSHQKQHNVFEVLFDATFSQSFVLQQGKSQTSIHYPHGSCYTLVLWEIPLSGAWQFKLWTLLKIVMRFSRQLRNIDILLTFSVMCN